MDLRRVLTFCRAFRTAARRMGYLPIMVKSSACYLRNMSRAELVRHKEESTGGWRARGRGGWGLGCTIACR